MVPKRPPIIFVGGIGGQSLVTKLTSTVWCAAFVKSVNKYAMTHRSTAYFADPEQAVGIDRNGLYWSIPQIERIQLFMGSNMQVNLYGSPGTCKYDD